MKNVLLAITVISLLLSAAHADCTNPVTYGKEKGFVEWIRFDSCATPHDVVGAMDVVLDSVRASRGLLIDLRQADGMSLEDARKIAERFMNGTNDWYQQQKLDPRGSWQYVNPIVILVDAQSKWPVSALADYLNHAEFSLIVGQSVAATADGKAGIKPDIVVDLSKVQGDDPIRAEGLKQLGDLMHKKDVQQRFEMEHMFHGK
jgi:hypothetical protein